MSKFTPERDDDDPDIDAKTLLREGVEKDNAWSVRIALERGGGATPVTKHPAFGQRNALEYAALENKPAALGAIVDFITKRLGGGTTMLHRKQLKQSGPLGGHLLAQLCHKRHKEEHSMPLSDRCIGELARLYSALQMDQELGNACYELLREGDGDEAVNEALATDRALLALLKHFPPGPLLRGMPDTKLIFAPAKTPAQMEALMLQGCDMMAGRERGKYNYLCYLRDRCNWAPGTTKPGLEEYEREIAWAYTPPFFAALRKEWETHKTNPAHLRAWLVDKEGHATPPLLALASSGELEALLAPAQWLDQGPAVPPLVQDILKALPGYYRYAYQAEPWPSSYPLNDKEQEKCTREPLYQAGHLREPESTRKGSALWNYVRGALGMGAQR